jgi:hypothetical protein
MPADFGLGRIARTRGDCKGNYYTGEGNGQTEKDLMNLAQTPHKPSVCECEGICDPEGGG